MWIRSTRHIYIYINWFLPVLLLATDQSRDTTDGQQAHRGGFRDDNVELKVFDHGRTTDAALDVRRTSQQIIFRDKFLIQNMIT